jgi:hypothetical protein
MSTLSTPEVMTDMTESNTLTRHCSSKCLISRCAIMWRCFNNTQLSLTIFRATFWQSTLLERCWEAVWLFSSRFLSLVKGLMRIMVKFSQTEVKIFDIAKEIFNYRACQTKFSVTRQKYGVITHPFHSMIAFPLLGRVCPLLLMSSVNVMNIEVWERHQLVHVTCLSDQIQSFPPSSWKIIGN